MIRRKPCGDGVGLGLTCGAPRTRLFTRGWRCQDHAPSWPEEDA